MSGVRLLTALVDGQLTSADGADGASGFPTIDPATEEQIGWAPEADAEEVEGAVDAARRAFDAGAWPCFRADERADALRLLADLLEENLDLLARAESADTGMTLKMTSQGHLPRSIAHLRHFAQHTDLGPGQCFAMDRAWMQLVQREPLGVIGILAPWNAPLAVATINLGAALAAGNTVVVKSSERAPFTLSVLAELVAAAELPPGVVNILHGRARPTGAALVSAGGLDGLCFVGSSDTGAEILASGASPFRRNTFELGGKAATIVLASAVVGDAVDGALLAAFSSNGEVCTGGSRILLHRPVFDEFAARFVERAAAIRVGHPLDARTEVGPLIDRRHLETVHRYVTDALDDGATLLCGGSRPAHLDRGFFYPPTVLGAVDPSSRAAREEIFGPVAMLLPFDHPDEAVDLANDSDYGLSASIWCGDASEGLRLARRIRCGVVAVNGPIIRDIRVPFGGRGASGIGRVGGTWSIDQYTEWKTTSLPVAGMALPRMGA